MGQIIVDHDNNFNQALSFLNDLPESRQADYSALLEEQYPLLWTIRVSWPTKVGVSYNVILGSAQTYEIFGAKGIFFELYEGAELLDIPASDKKPHTRIPIGPGEPRKWKTDNDKISKFSR